MWSIICNIGSHVYVTWRKHWMAPPLSTNFIIYSTLKVRPVLSKMPLLQPMEQPVPLEWRVKTVSSWVWTWTASEIKLGKCSIRQSLWDSFKEARRSSKKLVRQKQRTAWRDLQLQGIFCCADKRSYLRTYSMMDEHKDAWAVNTSSFRSPGPNRVFPALLQCGLGILISKLAHVFRACIAFGYVPEKLRGTTVKLHPKAGRSDYILAKYCRPITLMPFPLKTFESTCLHSRKTNWLYLTLSSLQDRAIIRK